MLYVDPNIEEKPIVIKDLSRNGTYVNGNLLGQNRTQIIRTDDIISVVDSTAKSKSFKKRTFRENVSNLFHTVFDFKDMKVRPQINLPSEVAKKYFIGNKLGSGAFGTVYKAIDRDLNVFALKFIRSGIASQPTAPETTQNEIKLLRKMSHVCIIKTIDIIKASTGTSLILEYMAGGDLLSRILSSPGKKLTEDQSRCIFYQIAHAVKYLHNNKIAHRDIKPENVLLKSLDEYPLTKLTDFGLSKLVESGTYLRSVIGTQSYIAPEIMNDEIPIYSAKVDVWSMGVTLFAMLSGTLPFADDYEGDVRDQILAGEYKFLSPCWQGTSNSSRRLIRSMLVVDATKRLDIFELFDRSWMNIYHYGIGMARKLIGFVDTHVTRLTQPSKVRSGINKIKLDLEQDLAVLNPPKRLRLDI